MSLQQNLAELFRRDLTRLAQEIESFPDDDSLWRTLPGIANCAGNLALHLEGNLREYVGHRLGGIPYHRDRPREFSDRNVPRAELITRVKSLVPMVPDVVAKLTETQLDSIFPEEHWGAPRVTRLFILHILAHLNYHLGQIDYLRRVLTAGKAVEFVQL
jgi:hypothetical protein